jgi:hypothetical protein
MTVVVFILFPITNKKQKYSQQNDRTYAKDIIDLLQNKNPKNNLFIVNTRSQVP